MEPERLEKEPAIIDVVQRLIQRAGPANLRVNDHWQIDLCAVGLSRPGQDRPLVYITTRGMPAGRYWVELEASARVDSEDLCEPAGRFEDVGFEELYELLSRFLRMPESRNSCPS